MSEEKLIGWSAYEIIGMSRNFAKTIKFHGEEINLWSPFPITDAAVLTWFDRCLNGTITKDSDVIALKYPPGTENNQMIVIKREEEKTQNPT